jgi:hypothetical protein
MRYGMTALLLTAALTSTALAGGAPVVIDSINGDGADYEIRRDTMTNALSAQDGGAGVLDVLADPSFDMQEVRSIFQFDLSTLSTQYASISSVKLFITLESVDVFPSQDIDLWGSTDNRTAFVSAGDAAATDEFDALSYAQLATDFAPIANPTLTDVVYEVDLTAFMTDRYNEYVNTPADRIVLLRAQIQQVLGTSFYNFYSGDAASQFVPQLVFEGIEVPAPASGLLLGLGGLGSRRRRTRG